MQHIYPTPGSDFEKIYSTLTCARDHARMTDAQYRTVIGQTLREFLDLIERKENSYHDSMAALHFLCELLSRPYFFPRDVGYHLGDILDESEKAWRLFVPYNRHHDQQVLHLVNARLAGSGVDFTGASLPHANLTHAHLYRKTIQDADLTGAVLNGALCGDVKFVDCHMSMISLAQATCSSFTITSKKASFFLPKISACGANLAEAQLDESKLESVNLQGASLVRTLLHSATLKCVDLQGANLTSANLAGATLNDVNLQGANLTSANLVGATLNDVNLRGANLTNAIWRSDEHWSDVRAEGAFNAGAPLPGQ